MEDPSVLLERKVMRQEYKWLLDEEVHRVLQEVHALLTEACKNFPLTVDHEQESRVKPEKFLLTNPNNISQVKCMVTLVGNLIYEADLALRLQKSQVVPHQTRIYSENPWRLQQIQDSGNHLLNALYIVVEYKDETSFLQSGKKVITNAIHKSRSAKPQNADGPALFISVSTNSPVTILDQIIDSIQMGRDCLTLPRKRTLEEIVRNPALKLFKPALPNDAVVSFYVQAQKLVLAVYHLFTNQLNKIDIANRYQLECSVPWLNDSLLLFTAALQRCQQLKDKLTLFIQCEDEISDSLVKCDNPVNCGAPDNGQIDCGQQITSKLPHDIGSRKSAIASEAGSV